MLHHPPRGSRCGPSPYAVGDALPGEPGGNVSSAALIRDASRTTVAVVYLSNANSYIPYVYITPLKNLGRKDADAMRLKKTAHEADAAQRLDYPIPSDLHVVACRAGN